MTTMRSIDTSTRADPIDMSLRFWSDDVPLESLLADLAARSGIFHVRGMPMPRGGRIARRHFASVALKRGQDNADVSGWIESQVAKIERHDELKALIKSGRVEAVFWIALFDREVRSAPLEISAQLVAAVAGLGAAIFVEDYANLIGGNPSKVWMPAEPNKALASA